MAMIACPDCNKEMSDAAPACPNCGKPNIKVAQADRSVTILLGIGIFLVPLIFCWFTLRKGYSTKARVISFCWLALVFVILAGSDKSKNQTVSSPSSSNSSVNRATEPAKIEGPLLVVTATDIASAYNENTVAADQNFKGKKFKVSGTVTDINTDFMGNPYVTLQGGVNQFMEPQFGFDKSASAQLASLKKGSVVTLICTGKGDVAKTPMSGSCSLH